MIAILKHVENEGPGLFRGFLKQAGFETKIIELSKNESLPNINDCQAIIVMGGPMNVYQNGEYSFLLEEEDFLRQALSVDKPILGVCLGAQILAKISGAKVYPSPKKEIGWYQVVLTESGKVDPLFSGLKERLLVFQWHEDTFDIPQNALCLASGEAVVNQAFRVGECAWGLQFHPEMISYLIKAWVDRSQESLDKSSLLFGYFRFQDIYLRQAKIICRNFAKIVREKAALSGRV